MFFPLTTSTDAIADWVKKQLDALKPDLKYGWDVVVQPHKKPRTYQQNRFLMAVMQHIIWFYHTTGFMPQGLQPWAMRTDILKEYWKARLGISETHKLDTKGFGEFVDQIQLTMVQESHGEYEIITPEQIYELDGGYL